MPDMQVTVEGVNALVDAAHAASTSNASANTAGNASAVNASNTSTANISTANTAVAQQGSLLAGNLQSNSINAANTSASTGASNATNTATNTAANTSANTATNNNINAQTQATQAAPVVPTQSGNLQTNANFNSAQVILGQGQVQTVQGMGQVQTAQAQVGQAQAGVQIQTAQATQAQAQTQSATVQLGTQATQATQAAQTQSGNLQTNGNFNNQNNIQNNVQNNQQQLQQAQQLQQTQQLPQSQVMQGTQAQGQAPQAQATQAMQTQSLLEALPTDPELLPIADNAVIEYDLQAGTFNRDQLVAFTEMAKTQGLTPTQAKALAKWHVDMLIATDQANTQAQRAVLDKAWGSDYAVNCQRVTQLAASVDKIVPGFSQAITESGAGSNATVLQGLHLIASRFGEDGIGKLSAGLGPTTESSLDGVRAAFARARGQQ